jgi:hypothetical protein
MAAQPVATLPTPEPLPNPTTAGIDAPTAATQNTHTTPAYSGFVRSYAIAASGGTVHVTGGPDGAADNWSGIQEVTFADGYLAVGTADPAAQVYRLYEATLGRPSDAEGLADWVHALASGASLQAVANGFVASTEFQTHYGALDNADFVSLLYQNVLGRAPDAGGLANWVAQLNGGESRAQVVLGFSQSQEFITDTAPAVEQGLWVGDAGAAQVARLYDTTLGRLPDAAGEISWTHALDSGADTLLQVAQGFVGSTEFQTVYGALSDTQFVEQLYQNSLHRAADTAGLNNWVSDLAAGASRAQVVVGFSESPEHIADTAPHIDQGIWIA